MAPSSELLRRPKRVLISAAVAIVALIALGRVAVLYADYLWFDALGVSSVFTTELWTKVWLGAGVFLVSAIWLSGNVLLATRLSPGYHFQLKGVNWTLSASRLRRWLYIAGGAFGLVLGFGFGRGAAAFWYEVLQFMHRAPFGWTDPVMGHDAQAYVFVLPIVGALKSYVIAMAVLGALGAAAAYFLNGAIGWQYARMTRAATVHLASLVALVLLGVAFGYWLDRYELLLSSRGLVFGAGYTDVNVRMPVYVVLMVLSLAAAGAVVFAGVTMRPKVAGGAVVLLIVAHVIAAWSYPSIRQRFDVEPNELVRETPYLEHNIAATRFAFGLSDVQVQPFPAGGGLTAADLQQAQGTIENVRLWDWRVLEPTYHEIQGLRTYYRFNDADIDRYHIDGDYRQVNLAVRELDQNLLQDESRTWVNQHLLYTHGYGLCMSPVNAVTKNGMPELWIRDIPPKTTVPVEVPEASVYFGESTHNYVFVRTRQDEFHYPLKDENVYTQYEGEAGVSVGSWSRRLLFAYYFGDWNVLLTDSFTAETRVLWRRRIRDRLRRIAPFLEFDNDPYPVIADGRLVWVVDAYTRTSRFPYAARATYHRQRINYIRNAVKVTVDAYDGRVRFYVVDPDDAIIRVARRIFPDLFHDLAEMPESLRAHLRYPIDLMDLQAKQYLTYHMTDPRVFYNREDLWERPSEQYAGQSLPVESYYIIMTLPGEQEAEYLLMLPFTPTRKANMIAWMAGRCDGEHYGKLLVYKFPKDRLVLGPRQIEANIDKNDTISRQLSLWDQRGSRVIRGNLLVIPIRDAILYVEPLYLDSEQTRFPELRRVIVATKDRVVMRPTLQTAMDAVFGAAAEEGEEPPAKPPAEPPPALGRRAREALDLFRQAQERLKDGDWAGYGEAMGRLESLLQDLSAPPETP